MVVVKIPYGRHYSSEIPRNTFFFIFWRQFPTNNFCCIRRGRFPMNKIFLFIWDDSRRIKKFLFVRGDSRRIIFFLYSLGTIPDEYNLFYSSGAILNEYNFFYSSGTNQTNKIMYFGILFNNCFSLFNSFIEMITREIHFNKDSFLKTLKTSHLYNKQWPELPVELQVDHNFRSK